MRQRHLKILRLILALALFLSTGFIFLDFRELFPAGLCTGITYLQFLPSLIRFFTAFGLLSAGFIFVLVLTSLIGRVYCSALCPLGILQDIVGWIRKKTGKKVLRYRYGKPHDLWRYSLLGIPLLILLTAKSLAGINLLDPYSIFGRIFSDLGQPIYMTANNLLARLFEKINLYVLYPEDFAAGRAMTYLVPSLMLALVVWFSFRHGRLYCNTVCPVGTLLGLVSRISVFRIEMIESRCTKCAKCVFSCKSSCIDLKRLSVDFSRCVGCFNCLQVCPEDAIRFRTFSAGRLDGKSRIYPAGDGQGNPGDPGRREAVFRLLAVLFLAGSSRRVMALEETIPDTTGGQNALPRNVENKIPTEIEPVKHFPVSPPGSLGLRHYTTRCTACHLCVSACPTEVLQPSIREFGLAGMLQPHMDYSTNYCNFQCVRCSEVCPTGAILSLTGEQKKTVQLGQVHLILENCVVYAENTACGSCSEHCPTQAVTMVPYRNGLTLPKIKPSICVGCGACEYACPVRPHKAIYVDGHEVHRVAEKPPVEELEEIQMEDFPF